jgi:hypothetical protein
MLILKTLNVIFKKITKFSGLKIYLILKSLLNMINLKKFLIQLNEPK